MVQILVYEVFWYARIGEIHVPKITFMNVMDLEWTRYNHSVSFNQSFSNTIMLEFMEEYFEEIVRQTWIPGLFSNIENVNHDNWILIVILSGRWFWCSGQCVLPTFLIKSHSALFHSLKFLKQLQYDFYYQYPRHESLSCEMPCLVAYLAHMWVSVVFEKWDHIIPKTSLNGCCKYGLVFFFKSI